MRSIKKNFFLNRPESKELSADLKNIEQKTKTHFFKNKESIESFKFLNKITNRKELENILSWTFRNYGVQKACFLAELLKEIGFKYATKGGISISIEDLKVPRTKNLLLSETKLSLEKIELKYKRGEITDAEWFQKRIASWNLTSEIIKSEIINYFEKSDPLNPVYMMAFSGARGNISQVRQLIGMRGLMSDQKGEIIGLPIQKNFREGLRITDFIISSYGARKGLVDTAIRTADSGYLTRRLIDIAQDVIISQLDCSSRLSISIYRYHKNPKFKISFSERILGRILLKSVYDPKTQKKIADSGQEVDYFLANRIENSKIDRVNVRSPLTCQSTRSICQKCYGWDLAQAKLVKIGEAVGILAAQSIGEPGTQLTMRTFHTGGIFTSELGQGIRIGLSGQINFSSSLKSHFLRTMDGDYVQKVENLSFLEIINYKNEKVKLSVEKDTLLFIKNKDFVKKDQIIGQVSTPLKNESQEETEKEIYSKFSGEIFYQFRKKYNFFEYNSIIWVLSSNIYKLPFNAKRNLRIFTRQRTKQSIGKTKLVSKYGDYIQRVNLSKKKNLRISQSFEFFDNSKIYNNTNPLTQTLENIFYILVDKKKNSISLNPFLSSNISIKKNIFVGDILSSAYKTKIGGIIYNFNLKLNSNKINNYQELISGGTLFWIPEEIYPLNREATIESLDITNTRIVYSGMEIAKNIFCKNDGILFIKEKKKIIQEISIKIGKIYFFLKETLNLKNFLSHFASKFFFPGETILEQISLKSLVYSEVIILDERVCLLLRPIIQYNVSKPKIYESKRLKKKENLYGLQYYKKFLLTKENDRIISNSSLNLVKTEVYFSLDQNKIQKQGKIEIKFSSYENTLKNTKLLIRNVENFSVFNKLPTQIKKQNLVNCFLVKKNQIIEPYTVISSFHISDEKFQKIYKVESKYSKYQEIGILSEKDITEFYLDEKDSSLTKNDFLFEEDFLAEGIKTKIAGKIFSRLGSVIQVRHGKPYLFSEGAILQKNHHDFVLKDDCLGLLRFKILKTEDIVQGLPKIEEILEARPPKQSPAFLINNPGFITKISLDNLSKTLAINIFMVSENDDGTRTINEISYLCNSKNSKVRNFQFVNLGLAINNGVINSYDLLNNYFDYYQKRDSLYKATLRSLNKIASLFIEGIQSIYYSQGIRISDKHIEVILRQMMAKVEIEDAGDTPILPGEFLYLKQIKIVNEMLSERKKKLVSYKPLILGLTKASLNTESFISAASFQQTKKVLSRAAIEGKIDWLRGLKENVIVGRLIPAGTGFKTIKDIYKK